MKILLDEGVPHELRRTLQEGSSNNSFFTAQYVGLTGDSPEFRNLSSKQKDEKLLNEAKAQGFDAVITIDKSMQTEQSNKTPIHVITLDVGRENQQNFTNIQSLIPELNQKIAEIDISTKQGKPATFSIVNAAIPEQQQSPPSQPEPAPAQSSNPYRHTAPEPERKPDQPANPYKRPGIEDDTGHSH